MSLHCVSAWVPKKSLSLGMPKKSLSLGMSKKPALQCLWLQCGSPQNIVSVIDISLISRSVSPQGVGILVFVLPALCGLHEIDRAKHLRPAWPRHSSTGNIWMLNPLLLRRACPAQRLSLTSGFNSFILGTAAVLAYGVEKKLVEELRSCRTWVSGWEKRWNLPLTLAVLPGRAFRLWWWRRENVIWFE